MGWEELLELSRRLVSELNDVKVELSLSSKWVGLESDSISEWGWLVHRRTSCNSSRRKQTRDWVMIGYEVVLLEGCEDRIFPRKYHPLWWAPEKWWSVAQSESELQDKIQRVKVTSQGKGSLVQHK
jgi:hypothetical protein